ncbi:MAG TPA: glutaredoxin domain-containing protein [Polyangiaceae bacterium]
MKPRVVVYRVPLCADCIRAECLLKQRGIHYQEVDVAEDDDRRYWLSEATGRHSLPQIFIDGEPIGGCSELLALDSGGKLALIAPATSRARDSLF